MFRRAAVVVRSVRTSGVRPTWLALRAWRHGASEKLVEFAGLIHLVSERALVDLLFIHGDHSYDGVRADFGNYAPLVGPGGLIAFHDAESTDHPVSQVDRLWTQLRDVRERK